jgi:tetratricopeptide (TPR) repeat protein
MMADKHRDAGRPSEADAAIAVSYFESAGPCQPDASSFADRLGCSAVRSLSMIRKLGPRDLCGFEVDTTGQFDSLGFDEVLSPSMAGAPGISVDGDRGPSWRGAIGVQSRALHATEVAPGLTVQMELGDRVYANPTSEKGAPNRPQPVLCSRLRHPEVPGYEILGELGRGGMGVVYKARQLRLNRVVALKMILAGDYAGPDAVERIVAEAEIVARLHHPNIVQIHATGDCDGRPYVELEYVPGGSLGDRLDGTPWPPRAAARLVESLALAMAEAHRMGIVHRDLKPANILMTDDGTPKITDFGLAKSIERDSGLTRTESILGSPRYMAPEQAEGHAKAVGPAADVYALGTNLYELLTGRPPFVAPTVLATLDLVKNAEPVPPRRLQPGLTSDLETICLKCLRKEPRARYESAGALAEDLTRFLNGEPILARPTSPCERAWKWIRRHPSLAALLVVSTLSILAAAGVGLWYRADIDRQREVVRRRVNQARAHVQQFVMLGELAIRRADWDTAKAQLTSALALTQTEPLLGAMGETVRKALALAEGKIAERTRRDEARARYAAFQHSYDEAVFYQSQYTGLEPEANLKASRAAARRALEQFKPKDGTGSELALDPTHFNSADAGIIAARYYEVALMLAEAISQPLTGESTRPQAAEALQVLERAERARPTTAVFHHRRAEYLERTGDRAQAQAEQRLAETAPKADNSSVDDFLEGESAYRSRDYKQAVPAFRRVLTREPDHFWAQYLLAICHLKEQRPAEAQAALLACQNRRPGFVWTYLLKGFAEGEMREFELAEGDFARAAEIGLGPAERYVMLVNRGVMRVRRGQHESAKEDFLAAIALKPEQFQAYIDLAQALQNLNRLDEALEALNQAIKRAPGQAVLYRARAQLHRLRSEDGDALNDLDRAIEQSTSDDPALAVDRLERGLILQQSCRYPEALSEYDRAIALQPGRPDVHRARAAVLVQMKRFAAAIRSFDNCLERGTPTAALYEARGLALAYNGSYGRAIADYTLALCSGPGTASLYSHRGWAYLFSGAPGPAAHDFDEALRREPSNGRSLAGRALANVQQRKIPQAIEDVRASTQVNAADARLLYNAARVYCQAAASLEADPVRSRAAWEAAGRYRVEAQSLITRSLALMPVHERCHFWHQVISTDSTLEPIRRSKKFFELGAQFARSDGRRSPGGAAPR